MGAATLPPAITTQDGYIEEFRMLSQLLCELCAT